MEVALSDVVDVRVGQARVSQQRRYQGAVARGDNGASRDPEPDGEVLLKGVEASLPAWAAAAREGNEEAAGSQSACYQRDEPGPLLRVDEVEDVEKGCLREAGLGRRIDGSGHEAVAGRLGEPAARPLDLSRVGIEAEVAARKAGADQEVGEKPGPAPDVEEISVGLEGLDDPPPGRARAAEQEVSAFEGPERRRRAEKSARLDGPEGERRRALLFGGRHSRP